MLGLQAKRPVVVGPDPNVERQLAETRAALAAQQARLEEERRAFAEAQNKTLAEFANLAKSVTERPVATPQGIDQETPQFTSDGADDEAEGTVDSLRRGRRSLRIDLATSIPGGSGTGLNVPRG